MCQPICKTLEVTEHKYLRIFRSTNANDNRDIVREMWAIYARGNMHVQTLEKMKRVLLGHFILCTFLDNL